MTAYLGDGLPRYARNDENNCAFHEATDTFVISCPLFFLASTRTLTRYDRLYFDRPDFRV
jgi:hypothetical protein